jgi:hypothetical protein
MAVLDANLTSYMMGRPFTRDDSLRSVPSRVLGRQLRLLRTPLALKRDMSTLLDHVTGRIRTSDFPSD